MQIFSAARYCHNARELILPTFNEPSFLTQHLNLGLISIAPQAFRSCSGPYSPIYTGFFCNVKIKKNVVDLSASIHRSVWHQNMYYQQDAHTTISISFCKFYFYLLTPCSQRVLIQATTCCSSLAKHSDLTQFSTSSHAYFCHPKKKTSLVFRKIVPILITFFGKQFFRKRTYQNV